MSKKPVKNTQPQPTKILKPRRDKGVASVDPTTEDPAVRAALSEEYPDISSAKALDIHLALEKLLLGQASLLARMEAGEQKASEQLRLLKERVDKMDEIDRKWFDDRDKFIAEEYDKADSLKVTGTKLDQMKATFAKKFKSEVEQARADLVSSNLRFEQELQTMPTEMITSPGVMETHVVNGATQQQLVPEVIRIKTRYWVLPPGVPTEVPKIVAERFREKELSRQETNARKNILAKQGPAVDVAAEWQRINKKYGSKTDVMRV